MAYQHHASAVDPRKAAEVYLAATKEKISPDELTKLIAELPLEAFDLSLGTGLTKLGGKMFRIGHLGDFNDLMLMGALAGVEMGLELARVPVKKDGVQAAMQYLSECAKAPARRAA